MYSRTSYIVLLTLGINISLVHFNSLPPAQSEGWLCSHSPSTYHQSPPIKYNIV